MDTRNGYVDLKHRIEATGIGYGNLQGVSWLMGDKPLEISPTIQQQIRELEELLSWMSQCIRRSYSGGQCLPLKTLLGDKVPSVIPYVYDGRLESLFRLDIAVDVNEHIYVTEREECGGALGILYALVQGYDVPYDIHERVKDALPPQTEHFCIVLTKDWWEYEQDLRVFTHAMREVGVSTSFYYAEELTLESFHEHTTLFLFGYFDNFARYEDEKWVLDPLPSNVYMLNPRAFYRESKVLLTLPFMPFADKVFPDEEKLQRLQKYIPWTIPISPRAPMAINWAEIIENQRQYIIKDAAYDGQNISWGGRGVQMDKQSKMQFEDEIKLAFAGDYPRVLQKKVHQRTYQVNYYTPEGQVECMPKARMRLSPFFIKKKGQFRAANVVLATFSQSNKVHGTVDSTMVPSLLH